MEHTMSEEVTRVESDVVTPVTSRTFTGWVMPELPDAVAELVAGINGD